MKTDTTRRVKLRRMFVGGVQNRARGDAARDRKDWSVAETEYSLHLATSPDDQPIWVQYGHCLKEQGRHLEAESAYRRAILLAPNDADVHLQLGHVLKLLGREKDAHQAYLASVALKPTKAAVDEVNDRVNVSPEFLNDLNFVSGTQDKSNVIYLEVDDLLEYLKNYKTLSGIQRVQAGIIQHAITQSTKDTGNYAFVQSNRNGHGFWRIEAEDLLAILTYIKQLSVDQENLVSLIRSAEQSSVLVEPVKGQFYFVLGAFWGFGSNAARYMTLKHAGLHVGVYIYDLIPITHPEYCSSALVSEFTFALGDGLNAFDFILTISEYVATDVRRYISKHKLRPIPVKAVPLAHQIHDSPTEISEIAKNIAWQGPIAPLRNRKFVLMVSTIEPRKNHIYLYNVWKLLLEEGLDPPDLVFVGRYGWRVNDLKDMLEGTEFLDGRIHVFHNLSDVALELLYSSCLFTTFPSVIEGWGLPVGESLSHGRPIVASNSSSIPEVGGDFVDYIDPWNVREGLSVFRKMIFDNAYRISREKNIAQSFVPRTWEDVGQELTANFEQFRNLPGIDHAAPKFYPGELLFIGELAIGKPVPFNYASRPLRTILGESWFAIESSGAWMRDRSGSLCFSTDLEPRTHVSIYLQLKGAPWSFNHSVNVNLGQKKHSSVRPNFPASARESSPPFRLLPNAEILIRVSGCVSEDRTIQINFDLIGDNTATSTHRESNDQRRFYFGLMSLAFAVSSDVETRVDLFERLSLSSMK